MAKKLYPEEAVQAIADSIRAKSGKTDKMTIGEMNAEIDKLYSDDETPEEWQARVIAEYERQGYKEYVVPDGTKSIPKSFWQKINYHFYVKEIPESVTELGEDALRYADKLAIIKLPSNLKTIGYSALYGREDVRFEEIPETVTTLGNNMLFSCGVKTLDVKAAVGTPSTNAFALCTALKSITFSGGITTLAGFSTCTGLKEINIPDGLTSVANSGLYGCGGLEELDLPASLTSIGTYAFYYCPLYRLILRRTDDVPNLSSKNAFTGTKIEVGLGYIYVPSALIDKYKTATNWATFSAQFRALEDYTVDGTTTGELDETKI